MELSDAHQSFSVSPSSSSQVAPSPSPQTLTLALPIQSGVAPTRRSNSNRDDCWSEGATSVLIDAWGERYLELSRGNLRQKHWQEVADAVTSRDGYSKPPKTDVQCKNRIDTLKKKYKVEKCKEASSWQFFDRLDLLLGPIHSMVSRPEIPQRQRSAQHIILKRPRSPPSVSSDESSDGFPPEPIINGKKKKENGEEIQQRKKPKGISAVTKSIIKLGQVYERVETSWLQQEMELEKHKIELEMELEKRRMQFIMKMQVEFE